MTKTYLREINGINYTYSCEEKLAPLLEPILGAIEKVPSERIDDGSRIEAGFSLFLLSERENGFTLLTLDYNDADPLTAFTEDLTDAIKLECKQAAVLETAGAYPTNVLRASDTVFVEKGAFDSEYIIMRRQPYESGSRWEAAKLAFDENGGVIINDLPDYEPITACELVKKMYDMAMVLELPDNYMVTFKNGRLYEIINDQDQMIRFDKEV